MELRGLCLRVIDYKDRDKLLVVASIEKGIVLIKARGVRSEKAKLKAGCMPMAFGIFSVVNTKGGLILNGIDIEENFNNCWVDLEKNLAVLLLLELIEKASVKGEEITQEILITLKALKIINYTQVYPFAGAIWGLLQILKYIGVDVTVENMPDSIKSAMVQIMGVDAEYVETLELYESTINKILFYLDLIVKNTLSINLSIIKEINKLIKL